MDIVPIVLCGGGGSRLWPLSREERPKQFHALSGDRSIFVETLDRLAPLNERRRGVRRRRSVAHDPRSTGAQFAPAVLVGSDGLSSMIERQAQHSDHAIGTVIVEPCRRDSAPALLAAILEIADENPDAVAAMLPSDHRIADVEGFHRDMGAAAIGAAEHGLVMTIGIRPTHPETQFGYIEYEAEPIGEAGRIHRVLRFREKPDLATARSFLRDGNFDWNAGIFVFRVSDMLAHFKTHASDMVEAMTRARALGQRDEAYLRLDPEAFASSPSQSIDYAIMEKIDTIGLVPSQFDWSDLGSWDAMYEAVVEPHHVDRTVTIGPVTTHDVSRSYLRSDGRTVLAAAGVEDLVIVADRDAVLVVDRNHSHLVKNLHAEAIRLSHGDLAARAKTFLAGPALDVWAAPGLDPAGGVREHLLLEGSPADDPHKRFRVLPRQIWSFCRILQAGMVEGDQAEKLMATVQKLLADMADLQAEDGSFPHLLHTDNSVKDAKRDTYDHCFVLLACAAAWKVLASTDAKSMGASTLAYMDEALADALLGGFAENDAKSLPRRANPHMHFLEAMLEWHWATGDDVWLDRAGQMVDLFEAHFFRPENGTLAEFFDADWTLRRDGADALIEPGHHYEWAWLLTRYDRLRPRPGLAHKARTLFAHARAYGHQPQTGFARDFINADGSEPDASLSLKPLDRARCWPQCEALKASLILAQEGVNGAQQHAREMARHLLDRYLVTDGSGSVAQGGWMDVFDSDGDPATKLMPASTFYHIVSALEALIAAEEG
ncbi:MAG: AGE family epimerase/isomerase [Pseudomonadota bacterium]